MGGVVVHDEVNFLFGRHLFFQLVEEFDELFGAMAWQAGAHYFPVQDVESGEQGGGAVELVIVGLPLRQSWPQGQKGSRPVQGLNLALLVHAQH